MNAELLAGLKKVAETLTRMSEPSYWSFEYNDRAKKYEPQAAAVRDCVVAIKMGGNPATEIRKAMDVVKTGIEMNQLRMLLDQVKTDGCVIDDLGRVTMGGMMVGRIAEYKTGCWECANVDGDTMLGFVRKDKKGTGWETMLGGHLTGHKTQAEAVAVIFAAGLVSLEWHLSGKTKENKEEIKRLGGTNVYWHRKMEVWVLKVRPSGAEWDALIAKGVVVTEVR